MVKAKYIRGEKMAVDDSKENVMEKPPVFRAAVDTFFN